jgi:hypothetical protein
MFIISKGVVCMKKSKVGKVLIVAVVLALAVSPVLSTLIMVFK